MAINITDKFGKASSATESAASTTVKTTREVGQQTLACFDLSAFAQDTPVYFITYQRRTDPTTGAISTINQVSYKGIVNIDNNSIVNMTPSAGFTDLGNSIGDYVECVPTSQWANDLVDGIKTTLKADGTLQDNVAAKNVNAGTTKIAPQNIDWAAFPTIEKTLPSDITTRNGTDVILSVPHSELIVGARYKITATVLVNKGSTAVDSDMYLRHGTSTVTETVVYGSGWGTNALQAVITYSSGGISLDGNSSGGNISAAGTNLIVERVG